MSLLKVKANKKVEKNKNEAKGTQVAFLLSSGHVVFFPPCFTVFLNPFCKGQKSSTNPIVSLPNILLKNIQLPSKRNKEGWLYP